MYGFTQFKWLRGPYDHHGGLQFPATLALDTGDTTAGVVQGGKPMGYLSTDLTKMAYATATNFLGLLTHQVDNYGTTGDAGMVKFMTDQTQLPIKRGKNVTLRQPLPGSEAEFESAPSAAAAIENLLATSGTGAISGATAFNTEIGIVTPGSFRVAQSGDLVFAKMLKADLTPVTATYIRVRLQFISPYVKA